MTLLHDITNAAPSCEALVRVYKSGKLTLNAAAKRLLDLQDDSKVVFRIGDEGPKETRKVYVGKRSYSAFSLVKVGNTYRIHSTHLCRSLADALQGYGTYRIEAENCERDFSNNVYYQLFFKRYE